MIMLDFGYDGMFWLLVCSERSFEPPEDSEQCPGADGLCFSLGGPARLYSFFLGFDAVLSPNAGSSYPSPFTWGYLS